MTPNDPGEYVGAEVIRCIDQWEKKRDSLIRQIRRKGWHYRSYERRMRAGGRSYYCVIVAAFKPAPGGNCVVE